MMFLVLSVSMFTLVFPIQPVKASETIYILADGSINPATAPIDRVGDLYRFTDNISEPIVIQADNIVLDGDGCTLQGQLWPPATGIDITGRNNVTVKGLTIQFFFGIWLSSSSNCIIIDNTITEYATYGVILNPHSCNNTISGNTIDAAHEPYSIASTGIYILHMSNNNTISGNTLTNSMYGLTVENCSHNNIVGNTLTNNAFIGVHLKDWANSNTVSGNTMTYADGNGIRVINSSDNTISGNTVAHNYIGVSIRLSNNTILSENNITNNVLYGVSLYGPSSTNQLYHNNFQDNTIQAYVSPTGFANLWDDGYPSGGNYWSDYTGTDADSDGIGDTPYVIDVNNVDRYPLMTPGGACTLTVNVVGGGSVSLNDTGPYVHGDIVELTALPDVGWEFSGWSGDLSGSANPATIVMYGNKTINANFVASPYTLTVNIVGDGSVSKTPDQATYYYGDVVSLDATADPGWSFDGWSGDLSGSANPDSITILGETSVTATFTEIPPAEALEELIVTVETMNLPTGTAAGLLRKLAAALTLLDRGNENGATHKLMDFINQVEAQRGIMITDEQADQLISEAQRIISQMQE